MVSLYYHQISISIREHPTAASFSLQITQAQLSEANLNNNRTPSVLTMGLK